MGVKNVGAAIVVALGLGTGLAAAVATPAQASPQDDQRAEQLDKQFLSAVRDEGLRLKSDSYAIQLAHSTCDVLDRGGSVNDALRHIKDATGWKSIDDITAFGGLAAQAYCPRST